MSFRSSSGFQPPELERMRFERTCGSEKGDTPALVGAAVGGEMCAAKRSQRRIARADGAGRHVPKLRRRRARP